MASGGSGVSGVTAFSVWLLPPPSPSLNHCPPFLAASTLGLEIRKATDNMPLYAICSNGSWPLLLEPSTVYGTDGLSYWLLTINEFFTASRAITRNSLEGGLCSPACILTSTRRFVNVVHRRTKHFERYSILYSLGFGFDQLSSPRVPLPSLWARQNELHYWWSTTELSLDRVRAYLQACTPQPFPSPAILTSFR